MGTKHVVKHRNEQEVLTLLNQAREMGLKIEELIDDETSNRRIASERERKLFREVADTFKVIATKYRVMHSVRFEEVHFVKEILLR